jgi:serine/threonine protein kinase
MIDGRGNVHIADFGLAALSQEVAFGDVRSGTPAYMSPEQKIGKEVTVRSDLYSLGLVLYEMFTGKRPSESQSSASGPVKDLDPVVDRVIRCCLEEDPKLRPPSALSVAAALPGGDPIAAALAAGETPSPEMVAASHGKEGFRPQTAAWCCSGLVLSLLVAAFFGNGASVVSRSRLNCCAIGT